MLETDHDDPGPLHWAHRVGDRPAHQGAGQHQDPGAGQSGDGDDRLGELRFSHQRDGVDRDALAADVVPIRLTDRAQRHLADLRTAAHDDDLLAVDRRQRRMRFDPAHDRHVRMG